MKAYKQPICVIDLPDLSDVLTASGLLHEESGSPDYVLWGDSI